MVTSPNSTSNKKLLHLTCPLDRTLAIRYMRALREGRIWGEPTVAKSVQGSTTAMFIPRMDLFDDPRSSFIIAVLELPGLDKQDITLRIEAGQLLVKGERTLHIPSFPELDDTSPNGNSPMQGRLRIPVQELKYGKYSRCIALPQGTQVSLILASPPSLRLTNLTDNFSFSRRRSMPTSEKACLLFRGPEAPQHNSYRAWTLVHQTWVHPSGAPLPKMMWHPCVVRQPLSAPHPVCVWTKRGGGLDILVLRMHHCGGVISSDGVASALHSRLPYAAWPVSISPFCCLTLDFWAISSYRSLRILSLNRKDSLCMRGCSQE
ncbi:hypothetical protein HGRIS_001178 [Hohenbuehelia grisea]|uniref:SHSP domain-containing protein n=1 Tax=Hohenbuehelia grisea TaxID=104357 RepID=A0ABR3JNQ6_9AGAR